MSEETIFDRLGIGGNLPPSATEISVGEMKLALEPLQERLNGFVRAMANAQVRTRAEVGQATDLLGLARGFSAIVDEKREEISKPLYDAHKAVVATAANFLDPLVRGAGDPRLAAGHPDNEGTVHGKIKNWQAAEAKRVADQRREQAETEARLRAEAAPAAVAPAPVDNPVVAPQPEQWGDGNAVVGTGRARLEYDAGLGSVGSGSAPEGVQVQTAATEIRGDYGHTLRSQAKAKARVVDWRAIPEDIMTSDAVTAAICKVADSQYRHRKNIPGIAFDIGSTNRIS